MHALSTERCTIDAQKAQCAVALSTLFSPARCLFSYQNTQGSLIKSNLNTYLYVEIHFYIMYSQSEIQFKEL